MYSAILKHKPQVAKQSHVACLHYTSSIQNKSSIRKESVTVELPFSKAATKAYGYVLPRAAFFDSRSLDKHKNATVLLAHMNKTVIGCGLIVACIVDGHHTEELKVKSIKVNKWIHTSHPECTHDNVLIYCYDTPAHNNSRVSVVYVNPENSSEHFVTESEHPLFFPGSSSNDDTNSSLKVMTCTTVYGTPPYFGAWVRYQKTLGVDMVYINAQESFVKSKAFNDTFFQESLSNGFIQLKVWKDYLGPGALYYYSQALYYQNCLYRFQGMYDYSIFGDTDDFFIPRGGKDLSIHQLLWNTFNLEQNVSSIRLSWIRYVEPVNEFNFTKEMVIDGNLTRILDVSSAMNETNFKSVHKLSATVEIGIHEVTEMMPAYSWIIAPHSTAYMAHIKKHRL